MKCFFAPNELKTWQNIHNGSVKPFGASQLILSEKKQWKFVSLRMSSQLDKTFRTAHLSQLEHHELILSEKIYNFCFASTELKTWQNIHNGSVKTLGASQLILSERKKCYMFSLRMSSKLDKTFRMAQLSHLEHHILFWAREEQWQCFFAPNDLKTWENVPNGSVKPVESITAHCERENFFYFFRSEWAHNLTKRSERLN